MKSYRSRGKRTTSSELEGKARQGQVALLSEEEELPGRPRQRGIHEAPKGDCSQPICGNLCPSGVGTAQAVSAEGSQLRKVEATPSCSL